MAASVSGSKTCSTTVAPHLTGSALTTLMATAPENMTIKQLWQILEACQRTGNDASRTSTVLVSTALS